MKRMLRFGVAAWWIVFCGMARAELRLAVEVDGALLPAVELRGGELYAGSGATPVKALVDAKAVLEGDLRASGSQVYWSPAYGIIRPSEGESRRLGTPYTGRVAMSHTVGVDFDGKTMTSMLLRTWPDALTKESLLVFAWIVDGKVTQTKTFAIDPATLPKFMRFNHAFAVSEADARGQAAILLWCDGAFIAPGDVPADTKVAQAKLAVIFNDAVELKALLSQGLNPNAVATSTKTTLMHLAAEAGSEAVIDVLVAAKARINDNDSGGLAPLHIAAMNGRTGSVQKLLVARASRNAQGPEKYTPLLLAARSGHFEAARVLCEARADMESYSERNESPFSLALNGGHADLARLLLERGYKYDFSAEQCERVLITQAAKGNTGVVRLFLEKKVKPTRDELGTTALQAAATANDVEAVRLLVQAGAKVDQSTETTPPALALAASRGYLDVVRALLAAGANPNARDKNGSTALHFSGIYNDVVIVNALLEGGADSEVANVDGLTPIGTALMAESREVVELLRGKGVRMDWRGPQGAALLEGVLRLDHVAALTTLLDEGLPADFKIREGWVLTQVAVVYKASGCVELLKSRAAESFASHPDPLAKPADLTQRPKLAAVVLPDDPRPTEEEYPKTSVQVELVVGATGEVLFPRVVRSTERRLDLITREALKHWRFTAAMKGDQAVAVQVLMPVSFPSSADRPKEAVDVDVLPRPTLQGPPNYPMELRRVGAVGQVMLEFVVNKEGIPEKIRSQGSTHPLFEKEAIIALQKWRFQPGLKDGVPVNTKLAVPIVFSLNN